jgi:SecD/SecF fusion protein
MLLVALFMIAFYRVPGLAASLALFGYCVLVIFALWLFDITLTLPGIAGIVLSIGMAVDANVIIFARIREELTAGSSVNEAIKTGFHKALSAILDGNITTLIAAAVLAFRGSGPVRGFAYTLGIGVVISMFTALVVTRHILYGFFIAGLKDVKFYGKAHAGKTIDFLSKRWIFIGISLVVLLGGIIGLGVQKSVHGEIMNFSLEFMGGSSTIVEFNNDYTIEEISQNIVPIVAEVIGNNDIQTQKIDGTNQVVIKTRSMELEEREAFNQAMLENFDVEETSITSENISSVISGEMKSNAVWALVLALVFMLVYIWFRFKDVRFAGSAVIALVNDCMMVLVFYILSWTTVGTTFIAVMLTIVGYSINATIVIFDRIRENLATTKKTPEALRELTNRSITQTLSRSINTTLTTFIALFVLWVLGVASIREFAAPLMVGLLAGMFSSVCLTGAIWYMFRVRIGKKA